MRLRLDSLSFKPLAGIQIIATLPGSFLRGVLRMRFKPLAGIQIIATRWLENPTEEEVIRFKPLAGIQIIATNSDDGTIRALANQVSNPLREFKSSRRFVIARATGR